MKYKLIVLLFVLFTLPSAAQVKRYTANGADGVILDWKKRSVNLLTINNDRIEVTSKEVELFEKAFNQKYADYKDFKRQYLGYRENGKTFLAVLLISPKLAKTTGWKKREVACMDCVGFSIVVFDIESGTIKF